MAIRLRRTVSAVLCAAAVAIPLPASAVLQGSAEPEPESPVFRIYSEDLDPFMPFIRVTPRMERDSAVRDPLPQEETEPVFRTPLERFTLRELRVVGIVIGGEHRLAVVEDPRGIFHDLYQGTAVGVNEGTVLKIQEDRIIIQEKERDSDGTVREIERTLRLESNNDRGAL